MSADERDNREPPDDGDWNLFDDAIMREGDAYSRRRDSDPEASFEAAKSVDVKGDTLLWLEALATLGPGAEYSADEVAHLAFYGEISVARMAEQNRVDSIARRSSTLFGKDGKGEEIFTPWIERVGKRDGKHTVRITDEGWRQIAAFKASVE